MIIIRIGRYIVTIPITRSKIIALFYPLSRVRYRKFIYLVTRQRPNYFIEFSYNSLLHGNYGPLISFDFVANTWQIPPTFIAKR